MPNDSPRTPLVEAVIFDLGRVLVDYAWEQPLSEAARRMRVPASGIKEKLFAEDLFFDFERGRVTSVEFHARFQQALGGSIPFEEFLALWNSIFTGEIAPTLALAEALRAGRAVRVAVLSNTNELHSACMRGRFPWLARWEHVYLSNEIGQRKPDAAAYAHVLDRLGVPAARAAFVDDVRANVEAARALGLHGILAESPQAVADGLARLGVAANSK